MKATLNNYWLWINFWIAFLREFAERPDLNQVLRNCSPYNPNKGSSININSNVLSTLDESLDEEDQTLISRPSCSNQSMDWNVNETTSDQVIYSPNGLSSQSSDSPDRTAAGSKFVKRLLVKDLIWIGSQIASGMLFLQQNNCKSSLLTSFSFKSLEKSE